MTVSFFLLFLSLALLSLPSSINRYLFIFPIWEVKSESGGVKGRGMSNGGGIGERCLVHKACRLLGFFSSLLLCAASWSFSEGPGCLEFPPTPPSPLKSLCCLYSCTVHITSPAPSYSPISTPPPPPPANDSRARPLHKATAFSTSRPCTHTHKH